MGQSLVVVARKVFEAYEKNTADQGTGDSPVLMT